MTDPQAAENPSTAAAAPAAPTRKSSPVGRIVIGILLAVLAFEGFSYVRVTQAQSKLTAELSKAEAEDYKVHRQDVKTLLGGRDPDLSKRIRVAAGEDLYDVYYFNGLLKRRVLCVHYGVAGEKDTDDMQREMMEVMPLIPEEVLFDSEPAG